MNGLSPSLAIFGSSSTEMHHFVMGFGSKVFGISIPAKYRNNFGVNLLFD